jgi:hypothetical protein
MTINFALLDGALADAAKEAGGVQHYQGDWICFTDGKDVVESDTAPTCGTAMCLAGFIAVRAGAKQPAPVHAAGGGHWYFPDWDLDPETGEYDQDGTPVSEFAQERAGLTFTQACALWDGANTLADLRVMVTHLREHPDTTSLGLHRAARAAREARVEVAPNA